MVTTKTTKDMIDIEHMTPCLWILLFLFTVLPFAYLVIAINMQRTRARYDRMRKEAEAKRSLEDFRL